jgi:4a-hydroxytetrahydrobiopterin dehydratase
MLTGMAKKLTDAEIQSELGHLQGWTLDGNAIRKQYTLGGFPDAIAFVTRLAFDADAADHHPDIVINYKRVTLTFSTHSAGGLTEKDFAGAKKVDALV